MARKKVTKNISDFLGMDWQEQDPETPEVNTQCDFCNKDILMTEHYFLGCHPTWSQEAGYVAFTACTRCVEGAGIKW